MNILFVVNNEKKHGGPENWKRLMVKELAKNNAVTQISSINPISIINALKKTDIVQTYVATPGALMLIIFSKLFKKRVVHKISGDYYSENKDKKGFKRIFWLPFNMACSFLSNKITFPSEYMRNIIEKHEKWVSNKSEVIPNGIDLEEIRSIKGFSKTEIGIEPDSLLLVEVTGFNNLEKVKGLDILAKSFNQLTQVDNKIYLFILGAGTYYEEYKQRYESAQIKFLGYQSEAIRYIKACDLFVHFSLLDNFPHVLLEAMACNKPIQALPSGGIPEMLPKECLTTGNINLDIKTDCTEKMKKYSIASVSDKFIRLYESL